jgi:hypothetical protein
LRPDLVVLRSRRRDPAGALRLRDLFRATDDIAPLLVYADRLETIGRLDDAAVVCARLQAG